jgi:hypothetical protein
MTEASLVAALHSLGALRELDLSCNSNAITNEARRVCSSLAA